MQLLIMQFPPPSSYFLPSVTKRSPKHPLQTPSLRWKTKFNTHTNEDNISHAFYKFLNQCSWENT